ncbi:MAG: hypothetical protein ACRYFU_01020 [Janthinobacterium lividum]
MVRSAIGRVVLFIKKPELVSRLDLIEAAVALAAIPALFGFAYHRPHGTRELWELFSVVFVGLSIYQFFTPKMRKLYEKGVAVTALTISAQCALGGPGLWALLAYAFFDQQVWS